MEAVIVALLGYLVGFNVRGLITDSVMDKKNELIREQKGIIESQQEIINQNK